MGSIMQESGDRSSRISGVLLDLGGVIYIGSTPIDGALAAVERLRDAGLPLRFITNTTRRSKRQVMADLCQMGLRVSNDELLTPALLARAHLEKHALSPFLVVHPELVEDFAGLPSDRAEAVIVGDAGEYFTYDRLNRAYRKIMEGAPLLALAKNRNFKDADGELKSRCWPVRRRARICRQQKGRTVWQTVTGFLRHSSRRSWLSCEQRRHDRR